MKRILFMVFRLFYIAPFCLWRIARYAKKYNGDYTEAFYYIQKIVRKANKAGRVKVKAYGLENIPKENGFVFFPNHQGMFDVMMFFETCPVPFAFVVKKEIKDVILLKQIIKSLGSLAMDREDVRQSMRVINQMTKEVLEGRNFLIFPEGTRSKTGNHLNDFKAGSFKSAVRAKCPIVPCACIDSFKPFDIKNIQPVEVKLIYLEAIPYEEYKGMKTVEIAEMVKGRIEETIAKYSGKEEA